MIELDEGCALPSRFPSTPGCVFPVYHLWADLAALSVEEIRPVESAAHSRLLGFAVFGREDIGLWLANLSRQPQTIELPKEKIPPRGMWRMRVLEAGNMTEAMRSPDTFREKTSTALADGTLTLPGRSLVRLQHPC